MRREYRHLRGLMSEAELLIYAACARREPLRLPPMQAMRLNRLMDGIEGEKTGKAAAWRVNRSAYAKTG